MPLTGKGYAAFLPRLDKDNFQWFVEQLQEAIEQPSLFVADGAGAHKVTHFEEGKLAFEQSPPYCPERSAAAAESRRTALQRDPSTAKESRFPNPGAGPTPNRGDPRGVV